MSQRNDERYEAAKKRITSGRAQAAMLRAFNELGYDPNAPVDDKTKERLEKVDALLRIKLGLRKGADLSPYFKR